MVVVQLLMVVVAVALLVELFRLGIAALRRMNYEDPAWKASGVRRTYAGFDPALRDRASDKRKREDVARSKANKIAATSAAPKRRERKPAAAAPAPTNVVQIKEQRHVGR